MRNLQEIKSYMLKNVAYGFEIDEKSILNGKVDKHIELLLSSLRADEEVKFALLACGIYNGSQIVCSGDSILFITSERILYGQKGLLWTTVKSVNLDDCRDIETDTFGIIRGTIKINTKTEMVRFEAKKSEVIRLANIIEKTLEEVVKTKKTVASTVINQTSSADELKKFKELLDAGIITEAEFDTKKKQLLGL